MRFEEAINILSKVRSKHLRLLKILVKLSKRFRYSPIYAISERIHLKSETTKKILEFLIKYGLVIRRRKNYEGYSITNLGLDVLALSTIGRVINVKKISSRLNVGKESDIYVVLTELGEKYIMKVYRLGRTSFKKVRSVRPTYTSKYGGWVHLNIQACKAEYSVLEKLWSRGMPVPRPITRAYHVLVMEYVPGKELLKIGLKDPAVTFRRIIEIVFKIYMDAGIVHGDLSEYNILVDEKRGAIWIIDWPQWLPSDHPEAMDYLEKDIQALIYFFRRRYRIPRDNLLQIVRKIKEESSKTTEESLSNTPGRSEVL